MAKIIMAAAFGIILADDLFYRHLAHKSDYAPTNCVKPVKVWV